MDVRTAALKLLQKTFREEAFSNYLYESAVANNPGWSEQDRRLLKALYFGVLRQLILLDYILSGLYDKDFSKIPENIKIILRIGIYQIISMDKIPLHAAINEAVNMAKKHGHQGTVKLVNALLRRASRETEIISAKIKELESSDIKGVAIAISHPDWMVRKYFNEFGSEKAKFVLQANSQVPPSNFRVRNEAEVEKAIAEGVKIEKNLYNKVGVLLAGQGGEVVDRLKTTGAIAPQDQSSLIAVSLLEGATGNILELCSGRGNKTDAMFKYIDNKVVITCIDQTINKLRHAKQSLAPFSKRVLPICCDILKPLPTIEKYQYIFLDAPCSGLGVVRRHPEIKYRMSLQKIEQMAEIQYIAITNASKYLKEGGKLIYCVCSFEREETFGVINRFINENGAFIKVDIGKLRPDLSGAGLITDGCLRILPGDNGMDGFFAAMLTKTEAQK
jgi:16S rRNA (cytosine967-C5)-methyltransferase